MANEKIDSVREWAMAEQTAHTVCLSLGDETTSGDDPYEWRVYLLPAAARALAKQLTDAANAADGEYSPGGNE